MADPRARADVLRAAAHLLRLMRDPESAPRLEWRMVENPRAGILMRYEIDLPSGLFRLATREDGSCAVAIYDANMSAMGIVDSAAGDEVLVELRDVLETSVPGLIAARRAALVREIELL